MNLFEFEGKEYLRKYGITTPAGVLLASDSAAAPMEFPFVLKAQVMTGGRGKAGGVKVCTNEEEYRTHAKNILNMEIKGHKVHGLLAEQMMKADRELYISITQQGVAKPTLIFSCRGGMDIEQVAKDSPDDILKFEIDPFTHLKGYQKKQIAAKMGVDAAEADAFLSKLEDAFFSGNAMLVEINPLGVVADKLVAMDSKVSLDDHARATAAYRQALEDARDGLFAYTRPEKETTTVTYVPLKGDVGMISDGAGTGMMTLDLLTDMGLNVACFTELGGMTTEEVMYRALQLTLEGHDEIKALIIVLIGGFNRMDNMARGITKYVAEHDVRIPIFTRMCGTMEEEGIEIMRQAGFETYYDLTDTAEKLCLAMKEA